MKKLFAAIVAGIAVFMSGCTIPGFGTSTPKNACAVKVVESYKTFQANGVWDCMSTRMKANEFDANGWQSDKDVTAWLQSVKGLGITVGVVEFKLDPVQGQDQNGNTVFEYHYRLIPSYDPSQPVDPTAEQAISLVVFLDSNGRIVNLQ